MKNDRRKIHALSMWNTFMIFYSFFCTVERLWIFLRSFLIDIEETSIGYEQIFEDVFASWSECIEDETNKLESIVFRDMSNNIGRQLISRYQYQNPGTRFVIAPKRRFTHSGDCDMWLLEFTRSKS